VTAGGIVTADVSGGDGGTGGTGGAGGTGVVQAGGNGGKAGNGGNGGNGGTITLPTPVGGIAVYAGGSLGTTGIRGAGGTGNPDGTTGAVGTNGINGARGIRMLTDASHDDEGGAWPSNKRARRTTIAQTGSSMKIVKPSSLKPEQSPLKSVAFVEPVLQLAIEPCRHLTCCWLPSGTLWPVWDLRACLLPRVRLP